MICVFMFQGDPVEILPWLYLTYLLKNICDFMFQGDPVEILPWLYLGNSYHASQEDQLNKLGILALLNVAEIDTNLGHTMSSCFCHMNLPIADTATSDISCKFSQAIEFIGMRYFFLYEFLSVFFQFQLTKSHFSCSQCKASALMNS